MQEFVGDSRTYFEELVCSLGRSLAAKSYSILLHDDHPDGFLHPFKPSEDCQRSSFRSSSRQL
jgi:hypothetical protein